MHQAPPHSQIYPGTAVSIVLKQDQGTGRQVQGTVSEILTRADHPRGVKVRLHDGRVGRVQALVPATQSTILQSQIPESQSWQNQHTLPHTTRPLGDFMPPPAAAAEAIPLAEGERAEQIESLQSYEMMKHGETEDEKNQAFLQKEFPEVDGSLIAALYGDSKDLSTTREMLQELQRE